MQLDADPRVPEEAGGGDGDRGERERPAEARVRRVDRELKRRLIDATEPAALMGREREQFSLYETALPYDGE